MASSVSASSVTYWYRSQDQNAINKYPSDLQACQANISSISAEFYLNGNACYRKTAYETSFSFVGYVYSSTINCPYGNTGLVCNASCPAPNVMSGGQCVAPAPTCTGDSVLNPATNSCDLTCTAPKVPDAATQTCVDPAPNCGPGQYYDFEEKSCLYPEDDNCPPGANYDPAIGACACPSGSQLSAFGPEFNT